MQLLPRPKMITTVCLGGVVVPRVQTVDYASSSVVDVFASTVVAAAACQWPSSHGFVVAAAA